MQTFALEMDWLPTMVLLRRQWPALEYKTKRAIEKNPERKQFYQLCWHVGASQGDVAQLQGQNIDWTNKVLSFFRQKTGTPVMLHLGEEALALLADMASEGPLFPRLANLDAAKRARVFKRHCRRLHIEGVTLHSYRYYRKLFPCELCCFPFDIHSATM